MELSSLNIKKIHIFFQRKVFLIFFQKNFQSSKKEKNTLKMFFYFRKSNFSTPSLENSYFLREPLRVFHHCFFRCFHFTIGFYYCFRAFSLLIAFVHFITVSSGVFISPPILLLFFECFHFTKFLYRDFFCLVICFCVVVPRVLRI